MNQRIVINPEICHGKPVIRGTRVMVAAILGAMAGGDTLEQILQDYPSISRDDVMAALEYASQMTNFQGSSYEAS